MSQQIDSEEMADELEEVLEAEETPPMAFYLALRNALIQLEHQTSTMYS